MTYCQLKFHSHQNWSILNCQMNHPIALMMNQILHPHHLHQGEVGILHFLAKLKSSRHPLGIRGYQHIYLRLGTVQVRNETNICIGRDGNFILTALTSGQVSVANAAKYLSFVLFCLALAWFSDSPGCLHACMTQATLDRLRIRLKSCPRRFDNCLGSGWVLISNPTYLQINAPHVNWLLRPLKNSHL